MVKNRYPLPLIDDHLDRLRNKVFFTCLDLKDGFHHISISEDSRKFTSFISPLGQYEYCRLPFGICNGPAWFQKYLNDIFKEFIDNEQIMIYFDDIIIATEFVEQNLEILKNVLKHMKKHKLQIRIDKSKFLKTEIIYLGYNISSKG